MTGLPICAALVAFIGCSVSCLGAAKRWARDGAPICWTGLALIAVALWLAYAAGGA